MKNAPSHYEIFLKVAHTLNFSKAAAALHYTQAGVSHAIAAMEKGFKVQLFIRERNGVSITENGKRLVPIIQKIVNWEQQLQQEIFSINNEVAGILRIGAFSSVLAVWIPELIKTFHEQYPRVRLEIIDGSYNNLVEWLGKGEIDCAFLPRKETAKYNFYHLYRDEIVVVVSEGHPILQKKQIKLDELAYYPLVVEDEANDNDTRGIIKKMHTKPEIAYRLKDDSSILSFARAGLGVGFVPGLVLKAIPIKVERKSICPPQYRDIGLAVLPFHETVLFKVLLKYLLENLPV